MNRNGSFPLEMVRGFRAIHYQNFAILPLVYIAEIAARQGYDLYSQSIDGKDLHLAINFLMRCIEDNNVVKRYTTSIQDTSFISKRRELNWMEPYIRRFKNNKIGYMLLKSIEHEKASKNRLPTTKYI
jgi:poly(beta-D-mannuronate) lyase